MNWNDLNSIWRSQQDRVFSEADFASLQKTVETKHRQLARTLFWRDIRETAACLFVTGVFGYRWVQGDLAFWPFVVSVTILLGLLVFFIKELVRARRNRVRPDASLLAKLDADIAELKHQRYLLLNVATWYLAPVFVSWAIVVVSSFINDSAQHRSHPLSFAIYVVASLLLGWGIWALNRYVVRKSIEPQLKETEKLRSDFLSIQ